MLIQIPKKDTLENIDFVDSEAFENALLPLLRRYSLVRMRGTEGISFYNKKIFDGITTYVDSWDGIHGYTLYTLIEKFDLAQQKLDVYFAGAIDFSASFSAYVVDKVLYFEELISNDTICGYSKPSTSYCSLRRRDERLRRRGR